MMMDVNAVFGHFDTIKLNSSNDGFTLANSYLGRVEALGIGFSAFCTHFIYYFDSRYMLHLVNLRIPRRSRHDTIPSVLKNPTSPGQKTERIRCKFCKFPSPLFEQFPYPHHNPPGVAFTGGTNNHWSPFALYSWPPQDFD